MQILKRIFFYFIGVLFISSILLVISIFYQMFDIQTEFIRLDNKLLEIQIQISYLIDEVDTLKKNQHLMLKNLENQTSLIYYILGTSGLILFVFLGHSIYCHTFYSSNIPKCDMTELSTYIVDFDTFSVKSIKAIKKIFFFVSSVH